MTEEILTIFDAQGRVTGTAPRDEVHWDREGLISRNSPVQSYFRTVTFNRY
ncbi:hypothetical protein [Paenibacillus sonchi]|uniref:hypothetical protein n=1 Tax=Paenibacillus sonchi TaxID=373687 RepID=UPI001E3FC1EC|nr:hypothetical protein [Paenibacillus sonchi]MCE3201447.1 hypothetical protein [Paenibacillus sonchi]